MARVVRDAWEHDVEILLVHENDRERGGCEFAHFFQSTVSRFVPRASLAVHCGSAMLLLLYSRARTPR